MVIDGIPGEHISKTAQRAIDAGATALTFNAMKVPIPAGSTAESVEATYMRLIEESQRRYRESPEGIAAAARAEAHKQECQRKVNELIEKLPEVVSNMDATVQWLADFCQPADHIDVTYDTEAILGALRGAGYVEGFGVGNPSGWFSTKDRMGRYIIGQGISCLADGMPPHGITITFAEKYRALREAA